MKGLFLALFRVQSGHSLEGQGSLLPTDALVLLLSPLGSQGQAGAKVCALWHPFWPVIKSFAFQVAVSISGVLGTLWTWSQDFRFWRGPGP